MGDFPLQGHVGMIAMSECEFLGELRPVASFPLQVNVRKSLATHNRVNHSSLAGPSQAQSQKGTTSAFTRTNSLYINTGFA
jgi:hypothetical protein